MSALRTLPITRGYAQPDSMSARLWRRAQEVLPGGNSRTTVFMAPHPIYAAEGESGWVTDVDGDRRLDLLNNYTSLIHGHAHPAVTEAATRRLARGASFPLPTPEEIELAALMCERVESVERVRFTNSGSEAVMMAIKGARGFTGRHRIAKFEGAYHGSYDYAEVSLGASPEEWGRLAEPASIPYSKGTPPSVLQDVVVLPFNYADLAAARIEREAKTLAAVLIDPMPNRAGLIPARAEFLRKMREVTAAHGILLIFDEVISFRLGYRGAQGVFDPRGGKPPVPQPRRERPSRASPKSSARAPSRSPRASRRSSTPTWRRASRSSPCGAASPRASSCSCPSAAPPACTSPRSRGCSRSGALSCRTSAVFSAWGMLATDLRYELVRSHVSEVSRMTPAALRQIFAKMEHEGGARLAGFPGAIRVHRSLDMRYGEQIFEIQVPIDGVDLQARDVIEQVVERFHQRHEELYAYSAPGQEVVIVNARVAVVGALPELRPSVSTGTRGAAAAPGRRRVYLGDWVEVPVHRMEGLAPGYQTKGQSIFESDTTTVLIREGERVSVTPHGWLDIGLG